MGARSRIEVIVESSRQKIPFTHFLCFPLYKSNLAKKVDEFKVRVLKDCFEVIYMYSSYTLFKKWCKIHYSFVFMLIGPHWPSLHLQNSKVSFA